MQQHDARPRRVDPVLQTALYCGCMKQAPLLLAALAVLVVARPASALPEWRLRYAAVGRLCQDPRNTRDCLDSLNALRAEMPGHPSILSAIAHTAMRLGDTSAVLRALQSLL